MLRDLSLTVPAGQRVLLVGPSGSGKSTLLRAIGGLLETADSGDLSGTVTVDGDLPQARPGTVGLVLQEPGAGVVAASVARDVAFGLENVGTPRTEMPPVVDEVLADVGLTMPGDTPTHALSGGETQRLALAGALALSPSVLLLDEPTAMLDPDNAAQVRATVARVVDRRRLTSVVVEHVLGPWVDFADRLVALDASGTVIADGEPGPVLREHGRRLADAGLWVPGVADPAPVEVPADLVGVDDTRPGPVLSASDLVVEREVLVDGAPRARTALVSDAVDARSGELTSLVGPSGSGKSTMLLALAGLLEPTDGRVVDGRGRTLSDLRSPELAELVAWVPQWSSSGIVGSTVLDEVLATSRALGRDEERARARAVAVLDALGLGALHAADPRQLSGGEQRRVSLAAALVHGPAALLLDEPTVGQDRHTWSAVIGLVEAARASGTAVVVATHDRAVLDRTDVVVDVAAPPPSPPTPEPRRTLAARCGPLSLLAASTLGVVASLMTPGWRASVAAIAVEIVLGALALVAIGTGPRPRGRLRRLAIRLLPGLIGVLSVGWSTWLLGGQDVGLAVAAGLRIAVLVLPSAVLLPYVDADELGDHLAQRLRLPARPVVAVSAALQRLNTFWQLWQEMSRARRVRGLGPGRSPVASVRHAADIAVGMLVRTLHSAADLAVAMDARGFSTAQRRTWAAPAPWRLADTLAVLGGLCIVLAVVLTPLT